MSWTTSAPMQWPPVDGSTNVTAYPYVVPLWHALADKHRMLGSERWPRPYTAWGSGTITSFSTNTDGTHVRTDSAAVNWMTATGCNGSTAIVKRWVGWSNECQPMQPGSYDCIIEAGTGPGDHLKIIHVQVTDNTATTLTLTSAANWVTSGRLANLAGLVGKRFFVVKRIAGWTPAHPWTGVWHNERLPELPNDQEQENGSCTGGTEAIAGTTYSYVEDAGIAGGTYAQYQAIAPNRKPWATDQFVGSDLLCFDGTTLRRVTVVKNSDRRLYFAQQAWTASGPYAVVAAGGVCWPRSTRFPLLTWYGGVDKPIYSHLPNDNLTTAKLAAVVKEWSESFDAVTPCEPASHDVYDVDAWSTNDNYCPPYEFNFSRWFYATLRGLQVDVEAICAPFVPVADYDGSTMIPLYSPATLFHECGINSGTATLGSEVVGGATAYTFAVPATKDTPEGTVTTEGLSVHWTVKYDVPNDFGAFTWYSGTGTVTGGKVAVAGGAPAHVGSTVVWSLGWTRVYPRLLLNPFYARPTVFVPDVDAPLLGETRAVDPPEAIDPELSGPFGVGMWRTGEPKDTTYAAYTNTGGIAAGGPAFITGTAARYVGDNFGDGTTGVEATGEAATVVAPYWEHLYVGRKAKGTPTDPATQHQKAWDDAKRGTATAATATSLTDATQDWWAAQWYAQGSVTPARPSVPVMRVEAGTATGGSTTTLIDTAKRTGIEANEPASYFWGVGRFNGFAAPWVGFILEVDKTVSSVTTAHKLPITGCNPTTGTLTFAAVAGLTVEAGDVYRIREPGYTLNCWKGRALFLIDPDGTEHATTVTHNDDKTLWFTAIPGVTPAVDWEYLIEEVEPGGVYVWDGTEHVLPSGADARGATWRANPTCNEPHKVAACGRRQRGDYVTGTGYAELYHAINKLRWTRAAVGWTSREVAGVAELNWRGYDPWEGPEYGYNYPFDYPTFAAALSAAYAFQQSNWDVAVGTEGETDGQPPYKVSDWRGEEESFAGPPPVIGVIAQAAGRAQYAYGTATVPTLLPSEVDFYGYAVIDGTDPDEQGMAWADGGVGVDGKAVHVGAQAKFDASGDPVLWRQYKRWDTKSAAAGSPGALKTVRLGTDDAPAAVLPDGASPGGGGLYRSSWQITQGYLVTHGVAVVRWDVAGGITYLPPP